MRILAIETSCDDTGIAVLEARGPKTPSFKVLSNIVSSQPIHQNYGGVFPMMAKREHQINLIPVATKALQEAKLLNYKSQYTNYKKIPNSKFKIINSILDRELELLNQLIPFLEKYQKPKIGAIAVTHGPGLEPCLWIGVNFAKALSCFWDIPIIPINHIEAHILVNFLNHKSYIINPKEIFPAISLVVSGGHTQLILVKKIGDYKIIGETRDDAAGECFDKCAKILGLGYPGGPIISKIATEAKKSKQHYSGILQNTRIVLPRPMINSKDYDFSFSGLKTAVLYKVKSQNVKVKSASQSSKFVKEMCVEVQQAIIDVLLKKTIQAAKDYKVKSIILGGGVSANQELRTKMTQTIKKEIPNSKLLVPDSLLSTDNALMIAVAGYFHRDKKTTRWRAINANANLRVD